MGPNAKMLAAVALLLSAASAPARADDDDAHGRHMDELERMREMREKGKNAGGAAAVRRHTGTYVRPDLGVGYAAITYPTPAGDVTFSGFTGTFGLQMGKAIQENVILALDLYTGFLRNPKVSAGGQSATTTGTSMTVVGAGPEIIFYAMPADLYVSATVALSRLTVDVDGTSGTTELGFAGRLAVGKEWWLGDKWGAGVAAQSLYSSNKDQGEGAPTLTTKTFGLLLSVTYN